MLYPDQVPSSYTSSLFFWLAGFGLAFPPWSEKIQDVTVGSTVVQPSSLGGYAGFGDKAPANR